jgi:hypothetical protein
VTRGEWGEVRLTKSLLVALCLFVGASSIAMGQAKSTASRRADLQIGAGFASVNSDYDPQTLKGFALYTTLDLSNHLGGEFVFHQANTSNGDQLYERTYEIGPRLFTTFYGRFSPYVKVMYGRGVFNFPQNAANLAYNLFAGGLGMDIRLLSFLNVRFDYEYQKWLSFPPTGLTPQVYTYGVAYHFPGGFRPGQRY